MVAFATREALERTLETGEMHYHSRSRGLWHKGATSGNRQRVVSLTADCDGDAVLARVVSAGPACHTGSVTCFGDVAADTFAELDATIDQRAESGGAESYTTKLLADRNLRLKKIGEEAGEFVTACADGDPAARQRRGCRPVLPHARRAARRRRLARRHPCGTPRPSARTSDQPVELDARWIANIGPSNILEIRFARPGGHRRPVTALRSATNLAPA